MVTLLNPTLIAFYWLMATARCQEGKTPYNYVYGFVGKEVEVSWPIPEETSAGIVFIKQKLEDGTKVNAFFIRNPKSEARLQAMEVWEPRLSGMYIEGNSAKVMISSLELEYAGEYVGMNDRDAIFPGCNATLVVVGVPLTPTVKALGSIVVKKEAYFECVHRSTTRPTGHGLQFRVLWEDGRFNDLGDPPSAKFAITDTNQLRMIIIERSDRGRKIVCATADVVPGRTTRLDSQRSDEFVLQPEYAPEEKDITMTTDRDGRKTVYLNDKDTFTCKCEAHCEPACSIQWSFKPVKSEVVTNFTDLADPKSLVLKVTRKHFGTFQCTAFNNHGSFTRELAMVINYIETPTLYINSRPLATETVEVTEQEEIEVKCSISAVPTPTITLKYDDERLLSVTGKNPVESVSQEGYPMHEYVVVHKVRAKKCEHPNQLECTSDNQFGSTIKTSEMYVLCAPSRAIIDDLELYEEYTYELDQTLTFSFVIRAVPDPVIQKVTSSLNGEPRTEQMPDDVEIVNEGKYQSKKYLTQFKFTCRRKLEAADSGRTFTLEMKAGAQTRELAFTVQLAGQSTTPTTPNTDVSRKTQRTPRRQPRRPPKKVEEESSLFAWIAIGLLALSLAIIIGVAFHILNKKKEAVERESELTYLDDEHQIQPKKSQSGSIRGSMGSKTKVRSSKTSVGTHKSEANV